MEIKTQILQNITIEEIFNFEEIFALIRKASDSLMSIGLDQWDSYYDEKKIREKMKESKFIGLRDREGKLIVTICVAEEYPSWFISNTLSSSTSSIDLTQYFSTNNKDFWFISAFAVDPEIQGKGIGKIFLNKLEELAKSKGLKYLRLDCRETGYEWLSQFYIRFGFKSVFRIIEVGEPDYLLMEKKID